MKKIMNYINFLPKKTITAFLTVALAFILTGTILAAYGPSRTTKEYSPGVSGFNYVTFNSFTNVPKFGDEREFFHAQYEDQAQSYYDPLTQVRNGDTIKMHVYIHNNADKSLNASGAGVAEDVTVRVDLPQGTPAKNHQSKATIISSNASPVSIYDTLDMSADNGGFFELDYVEGSAKLVGNGVDRQLSDALIGDGVNIGDLNGCFEYAVAVTFEVEIDMPRFQMTKEVRLAGEDSADWAETKHAGVGDQVQWLIGFRNNGSTTLDGVDVVDNIPENLSVVPDSVKLINTKYPSGFTYSNNAVQMDGRQVNVDIGTYNPGSNAYLMFTTIVDPNEQIPCGTTVTLTNTAWVSPELLGSLKNEANLVVTTDECPVEPILECTSLVTDKLSRNKFRYTITARAENVEIQGYALVSVDEAGDDTIEKVLTDETSAEFTIEYREPGDYRIFGGVAALSDSGEISAFCEDFITVEEEPEEPIFACRAIDILKGQNRKVKVTVHAEGEPEDQVTITGYHYDFGDGTKVNSDDNVREHTYAKDGTYTITVTVKFDVNGEAETDKCAEKVTFKTDTTPVTPPSGKLPDTGPSSAFAALFGTSTLGTAIRGWLKSRAGLRKSFLA